MKETLPNAMFRVELENKRTWFWPTCRERCGRTSFAFCPGTRFWLSCLPMICPGGGSCTGISSLPDVQGTWSGRNCAGRIVMKVRASVKKICVSSAR